AVGVSFEDRGDRTNEYIEVLRALWADGATSFDGEFARFDDMISSPKPVRGAVPIVIGGHSHAAARRAGRLGDGFFPAKHDNLAELVSTLRKSAREAGRDPDVIELSFSGTLHADKRKQLEDLGATRLVFGAPLVEPDAVSGAIEQLLDSLA
ncbi:MAG: LLM class flavin-dependent oxidoreductase, partial [Actinobacteria bacterium]|nr:LLM class flavin-dependent oxidoreductase [Actinomycetota bacterium]